MRSIQRRFVNIQKMRPFLSSYICFASTVAGQKFTKRAIYHWFNRLVDEIDYFRSEKKGLIKHLCDLTNDVEECIKSG